MEGGGQRGRGTTGHVKGDCLLSRSKVVLLPTYRSNPIVGALFMRNTASCSSISCPNRPWRGRQRT